MTSAQERVLVHGDLLCEILSFLDMRQWPIPFRFLFQRSTRHLAVVTQQCPSCCTTFLIRVGRYRFTRPEIRYLSDERDRLTGSCVRCRKDQKQAPETCGFCHQRFTSWAWQMPWLVDHSVDYHPDELRRLFCSLNCALIRSRRLDTEAELVHVESLVRQRKKQGPKKSWLSVVRAHIHKPWNIRASGHKSWTRQCNSQG